MGQRKVQKDTPKDVNAAGEEVEVLPAGKGGAFGDSADEVGKKAVEDGGEVSKDDWESSVSDGF